MKFVVSSAVLLDQLSLIKGAIPKNPVMPILENFLFEIRDGKLVITASDLQTSMITELPIDAEENASIAVPAGILTDTLNNLPSQPVSFFIDTETFAIELNSENGRYKLAGENAIDFPRIPSVKQADSVEIPAEVLQRAINYTIFCTGTDDLRPAMTGVLFELNETESNFVATDGHRLVRYRRSDIVSPEGASSSLILPRKALNLLKSALPNDKTPVTFSWNTSNAYFTIGSVKMICRLIDERYPDYEGAIPMNNPYVMVIQRVEFLNSLKRIAIYASKTTHQVRLKISRAELTISAEDLDFSNEANERLECDFDGEDTMEIGFNARLLMEMLNNLESSMVRMELLAPSKQGLLIPNKTDESENILMLVMPVMLNSYATY
ncbi:MAG: DNA polymerase III subunit beta [Bacteroidota bacterium]